jgi:hypothetical protein
MDSAGNLSRAITVFLASGVYGFVLALAFRQTGSLAAPLGLNLGWHFVGKAVFRDSMPTFQMFVLPEDAALNRGGPFGGIVSIVVLAGVLVVSSWWLLGKYGIQTVRTES